MNRYTVAWAKKKLSRISLFPKRPYPTGVSCTFIPLDKKVGVKLYFSEGEGCLALKCQKAASRIGIAPKVYGKLFTIRIFNGGKCYCFLTERVEVLVDKKIYAVPEKVVRNITGKLRDIDLKNYNDDTDYSPNVGINSKGEYVLIDFGGVQEVTGDDMDDM